MEETEIQYVTEIEIWVKEFDASVTGQVARQSC
jgi:hypothetical protein